MLVQYKLGGPPLWQGPPTVCAGRLCLHICVMDPSENTEHVTST